MKRLLLCLIIILTTFCTNAAYAQLKVTVNRGTEQALPLAISPFKTNAQLYSTAQKITSVIQQDLNNSGLFQPLAPSTFLESNLDVESIPTFGDWTRIGAQGLITGSVVASNNSISLKIRIWDTVSGRQLSGRSLAATPQNWRRLAHMAADEIYKSFTGKDGYFDTRIVFIAERGNKRRPTKQLAIMDQDGQNVVYLTRGDEMALTPRFDKQAQRVIYLNYKNRKPNVYLYDLETGREELLGRFSGMSFAPRFSYDGNKAIMSAIEQNNTDIYVMDIASRAVKRLTTHAAIDTSPSFAPDGKHIVFNSDRSGSQQLFVMDANGRNVKKISNGRGIYATPVWSPTGEWIAFTKMTGGKFHIGIMRPDGSDERLLTESYLDEGPTWAPNGQVIAFSRKAPAYGGQPGRTELYSVNLSGENLRRIPTQTEASDPAWSPLLSR